LTLINTLDATANDKTISDSRELYLDLLKHVLTDTLLATEPNADQDGMEYLQGFINHYIRGRALTMVPLVRLHNLHRCAVDVIERHVPGDFIETGVWRGGTTIFMRAVLRAYASSDRKVWVADSFEGLPEPDADKYPIEAETHHGKVMSSIYDHFAVGLDEVRENFARFGLLDDQVRFLKGWFKDTLPAAEVSHLSVMRLDGDYYESTHDALLHLYPKLSPGGYVIVDDYGEDTWTYCRRAVDDFRDKEGLDQPLMRVDSKCFYWQK
jgi:Macrocin-O-methyltransferase (TylF)